QMEAAGVDLLVLHNIKKKRETRAALIAARETTSLPVMATMTFEADGRTLFGTDARTAAIVLESLGADAIGVNCSTGPAKMKGIVEAMAQVSTLPLIAKPNAGLPGVDEQGNTFYDMDRNTFAAEMEELAEAGAVILGGCCGTDPAYIAELKRLVKDRSPQGRAVRPEGIRYLTSERQTVAFGLDDPFMIVGERINPTGKKKLQEQLRAGNMDMVLQFAREQEECGASILDVNMGMSGIEEKAMMLRTLEEVQGVTSLPLSLDSSHVEVLEAALRHYPGRALVNSVSYETEKFEKLLPIVQKYGAMFILLPLSDQGLPENLEEKEQIIEKIVNRALELGMSKEDIVVDGLVATIGANRQAGLETLETIRYCKAQGLATICGLSNISFGMPARPYVNTAFLSLAIYEGLTMAIANPSQEMLVCGALATDLLKVKRDADLRYIDYASRLQPVTNTKPGGGGAAGNGGQSGSSSAGGAASVPQTYPEKITDAVMKGNRNGIAAMTAEAVSAGEDPARLLNEALLPAINKVGDYFEQKKYFLPQLIASAEAMKNAIEVLEPYLLKEQDAESMPVVVIATVEGDIHDIGKNLVALMLKNYGFRVIDLGKDVPKESIIQAAREHHADIIALSALMTTTMQRMREVVDLAKREGITAKIMIGGAVITQEYADEIHADGYSGDAAEAVKLARRLLGIMNAET
ncbi:MAG: dihydropteroate synthase, partial [Acetatifactor sp.]|nr:dihydropteroate synthase [Acetatifactor sp.]